MPKPLLGNQIAQDTFEKLKDQAQAVPDAIQDVATGQDAGNGDSGIELQSGKTDPTQLAQQAQQQGLTPQKLAEKEAEQKRAMEYHRNYIKQIDEEQAKLRQESEMKKKREAEEEQARKQQEIVELREEEAKATVLHPRKPSTPKGPGSAFVAQSTKSQTEFSRQASQ